MKINGIDTTSITKINGIAKASITKIAGVTLPPEVVTTNLVMYLDASIAASYPGSGSTWTDITYNGFDGTLVNGPTYSSADGGSILLDGSNDSISTTFNSNLEDFTICCWFKATDSSMGAYTRLMDKDFADGFWLGKNANNANSWGGGVKEPSDPFGIYLTLTDGQWNFIASVRDTVAFSHTLYGNGIANTTTMVADPSPLNGTNLLIGQYIGGFGYNFNGNIGLVQAYNRALTSTEVLQNYNATKTRFGY